MMIFSIGLGKFNTVCCFHGSSEAAFQLETPAGKWRILIDPEDSTKIIEIQRADIDVLRSAPSP